MNVLSRDQQIAIISALCDGDGQRAVARLTGTDRKTVARLALRVGNGCVELHDRMFVGIRTNRLELDELWSFVQRKRRWHQVPGSDGPVTGDQYTFIALSASSRAIVSYLTGKRSGENTDLFIQDLRQRVVGHPEFSTDGWRPYKNSIGDIFGNRAPHGVINKTYSVTHLAVNEASRRYSPAQVVAVARDVVSGVPAQISTSYVERSHLTLRQSCKRFARLGNGFSKRLEPHCAAIALYVSRLSQQRHVAKAHVVDHALAQR
jgi:IS1 family transposase